MLNFRKIVVFLVVFVSFVVLNKGGVLAATTSDSFTSTFISGYSFVDSTGHWGNFEYVQRKSDGEIAYCIEPGISKATDDYHGYYDLSIADMASKASLTQEQLERVTLIAYFGWKYNGHWGYDWIVATQALIWEETGRDYQFTSQNNPSNPYQYVIDTPSEIKENMNEIKRLIDLYLKKPDFGTDKIVLEKYKTSSIYARDNSLDGYEIYSCKNCNADIYDNELRIVAFNIGGKVNLKKTKKDWPGSFVVYAHATGQNLLVPGNIPAFETTVSYDVVGGEVHLKKYDADTKTCKSPMGTLLRGSRYALYNINEDKYEYDLDIDSNCSASLYEIPLGEYYIQEIKAGKGYTLDSTKYYFTLDFEHPTANLEVYDKVVLGQVEIEKLDSRTKNNKSSSLFATLKGAKYGIYKEDGTLLEEVITKENGKAISSKSLLIGSYYIQEIEPPIGYQLDMNKYFFKVTDKDAETVISIPVYDQIYHSNIHIKKSFLKFGIPILEMGAEFTIYANDKKVAVLITDENGEVVVDLPYGKYILKQTKGKDGYHLVDDIVINIDENTNEEIVYDLVNYPFRGTLVLIKEDKVTNKNLANAVFDICSIEGECRQGATNEEGIILLKDLEYGSYSIKEVQAPKGYTLSTEPIYFELLEDGQEIYIKFPNVQEVMVPSTGVDFRYLFVLVHLVLIGLVINVKKRL